MCRTLGVASQVASPYAASIWSSPTKDDSLSSKGTTSRTRKRRPFASRISSPGLDHHCVGRLARVGAVREVELVPEDRSSVPGPDGDLEAISEARTRRLAPS